MKHRTSRLWPIFIVAALITLLNAAKPLHIDDTFHYRVAEQILSEPLDPYGFDIFWLQWPQPVHEELIPPVLPYWLALGIGLLGGLHFTGLYRGFREAAARALLEHGVEVVDGSSALEGDRNPGTLFRDPVHFNPRGYERFAELLAPHVGRFLPGNVRW